MSNTAPRRRAWPAVLIVVMLAIAAVTSIRSWREASRQRAELEEARQQHPRVLMKKRQALLERLRPVAITNCELQRFGEAHDGGYLMCGNLLRDVRAGYSYGINGYDKWGCDIATRLGVTVHQYDCFNPARPVCSGGSTTFHDECVAGARSTSDGRLFDSIANQLTRNGDVDKHIALKIDVEGAEWDSLMALPEEILQRIDQLAVEFHWRLDGRRRWAHADEYLPLVERLKTFFEVAHLHFNNHSCRDGLDPLPAWAFEVLFVNKRLAVVDPNKRVSGPNPLDAPNDPSKTDCQLPATQ
jgi:hypothetical protein